MIIDTHTHIYSPNIIAHREHLFEGENWFRLLYANKKSRMATGDDLLASMDQAGIDVAVTFGFSFTDDGLLGSCNDYVLSQAAAHPTRLVPLAVVNPRSPNVISIARQAIESGARGLGELVPDAFDAPLDHAPLWDPLCALAAASNVPILLHVAEQVGHVYPGKGSQGAEQAYRLIERHPETRFVLAHWGGGLPFYELMPEVGQALANTWYDTAASPYLYRDEVLGHVSRWAPEKILFGTDYPLIRQKRFLERARHALLGSHHLDDILANNAIHAFGLEEWE